MPELARVSCRQPAAKLKRAGYREIRTSRHPVYQLTEKDITIPVPRHPGEVPIGTLRAIVREMGLAAQEFNDLLSHVNRCQPGAAPGHLPFPVGSDLTSRAACRDPSCKGLGRTRDAARCKPGARRKTAFFSISDRELRSVRYRLKSCTRCFDPGRAREGISRDSANGLGNGSPGGVRGFPEIA